jgi:hypothetical protein
MPTEKGYSKIEVTDKVYRLLKMESGLTNETIRDLASELILKGLSKDVIDLYKARYGDE